MNDPRQELASELERLVRSMQVEPKSAAELEKLKAGLAIVVEAEKERIAAESEEGQTWFDIWRSLTPLLVTGILGGVVSVLTLVFQAKQHAVDVEQQAEEARTAGDRQAQQLQATAETTTRHERTELLERLAQSVASGPAPAASCWYVQGIWADYSKDEPLPEVLAARCGGPVDAGVAAAAAATAAQWVVVTESDSQRAAACEAAGRARRDGLENVQVSREAPPGIFVTTTGQFTSKADAVGYLQRVHAVRANAFVARQVSPKWTWVDCASRGGDPPAR
jgi:hypothetical protein